MIRVDAAQIEQVLINLVHNAVDAALETQGNVVIGWREKEDAVEIFVQDEGPGIMNPANLFVPFFHYQTRRFRDWSSIESSNCRSSCRIIGAIESGNWPGRGSFAAPTALTCWEPSVPKLGRRRPRAETVCVSGYSRGSF